MSPEEKMRYFIKTVPFLSRGFFLFVFFLVNFKYVGQHKVKSGLMFSLSFCIAFACWLVHFKYLKVLKLLENSSSVLKRKISAKSE